MPALTTKTPGLAPPPLTEFNNVTRATTFFSTDTGGTSKELYVGDQIRWTRIVLRMISAGGAVAVGLSQNIAPPLSGRGAQLLYGEAVEIVVPPAQRLYYCADSRQRITMTVSPVPWLEQILQTSKGILSVLSQRLGIGRPGAAAAAAIASDTPRTIQSIGSPPPRVPIQPASSARSPLPQSPPPGVVRYSKR